MEKEKTSLMKLINKMNKKCSEVSKHTLLSPNEKQSILFTLVPLVDEAIDLLKDEEKQIIDAFANGYIENKSGQEYYNDKYKK